MKTIDVPFLRLDQPIGPLFIASINAVRLIDDVEVFSRGLSEQAKKNVQRRLNTGRQSEIAEYCLDPDATFPTAIIVSAYEECVTVDEGAGYLRFRFERALGEIIDGQHRVEGLKLAHERYGPEAVQSFNLPVVFMIDMSPEQKAYIFSTINGKQTPVSSSLLADLFGLIESRSPKKVAHDIAETFNNQEGGPFYRGIKMLGTKNFSTEILTQGAFVKYITALMTRDSSADESRGKNKESIDRYPGCPLRDLYEEGADGVIAKALFNYFYAVAEAFKTEWYERPAEFVLRKTLGFSALTQVFKRYWLDVVADRQGPEGLTRGTGDASLEAFRTLAARMKKNVGGTILTTANFSSNEAGAKTLATLLLGGAARG